MNKKKNTYKKVALVLALILLPIGAFTLGYFFDEDRVDKNEVANTLVVEGDIGGTVTEEINAGTNGIVPQDTIDRSIVIKPNCTTPSLLRVKVEPYWDGMSDIDGKKDSSNLNITYNEGIEIKNDIDTSSEKGYWYKHRDGYLYYIGEITEGTPDINLVKNLVFDGENNINEYQGKTLKINVMLDIVQSKHGAFESAWKFTGEDAKLKDKLISISTQK